MANKSLDILIKVTDQASKKVDVIATSFDRLQKVIDTTKSSMTNFNVDVQAFKSLGEASRSISSLVNKINKLDFKTFKNTLSEMAYAVNRFGDTSAKGMKKFTQSTDRSASATDALNNKIRQLNITNFGKQLEQAGNSAEKFRKQLYIDTKPFNLEIGRTGKNLGRFSNEARKFEDSARSIKKVAKTAKEAAFDIVEFNKSIFYATTFIRFFQTEFRHMIQGVEEGARLDRVTEQFQAVFGKDSNISKAVGNFTQISIDRVEAMQAAISMKTLKITKDLDSSAEIIAMAGNAAKAAGFDAAEGVKRFTAFLKNGELSNLEFLNLLRSQNPELRTQLALLGKYGGVLGPALTSQEKYSRGMALLRAATANLDMQSEDLLDTIGKFQQAFKFAKGEASSFLTQALRPMISTVTKLLDNFSLVAQNLRKTDQGFVFLGRSVAAASSALTAFIATFGFLKLATRTVTFLGINVNLLAKGILFAATVFGLLTYKAKDAHKEIKEFGALSGPLSSLISRLSLFGNMIKGVFQLVSSYFKPENMAAGIGEIDVSLKKLLEENNVFGIVQTVAQSTALIGKFLKDVASQIMNWSDKITTTFENAYAKIIDFFGIDKESKGWFKGLFDESNTVRQSIVKLTAAMVSLWAVAKMFKSVRTLISKIPVIGKLLVGGGGRESGKGPAGTMADPIYTVDTTKGFTKGLTAPGGMFGKVFSSIPKIIGDFFTKIFAAKGLFGAFKNLFSGGLLSKPGFVIAADFQVLASIIQNIAKRFILISAVVSTLYGVFQSVVKNFDTWKDFGTKLWDLVKSYARNWKLDISEFFSAENFKGMFNQTVTWLDEFTKTTTGIKEVRSAFEKLANVLDPLIKKLGEWVGKGIETVKESTAYKEYIAPAGQALWESAKEMGKAGLNTFLHPLETFGAFGEKATDTAAAYAEAATPDILAKTVSNDIQLLTRSFGMGIKGIIPETPEAKALAQTVMPSTSEGRVDYLNEAIMQMRMQRDSRAADMQRAMDKAMLDNKLDPEEFANVLAGRLEEGKIGKNIEGTHSETKKSNTRKDADRNRRGGC